MSFFSKKEKSISASQKDIKEEIYHTDSDFISKIETGVISINLEQVNIISQLKDSLKKNNLEICKKKIILEEDYHSDTFILFVDKILLNVLFDNLLSNAIKFNEEGGRVKLQTKIVKKYFEIGGKKINEDGYVISFKNYGIGIPVECHNKIFSKMFRCDNAKKANIEGKGLGLYIVKLIMYLVGGDIWFESAENQGATFFIYLPEIGMTKR